MKSTNISSTIGRSPVAAAPAAAPTKEISARCVSSTRSGPNSGPKALGDAERPAPGVLVARRAGAAGNVLAHDDDAMVAPHFLADRLVDRLAVGFFRHGTPPSSLSVPLPAGRAAVAEATREGLRRLIGSSGCSLLACTRRYALPDQRSRAITGREVPRASVIHIHIRQQVRLGRHRRGLRLRHARGDRRRPPPCRPHRSRRPSAATPRPPAA